MMKHKTVTITVFWTVSQEYGELFAVNTVCEPILVLLNRIISKLTCEVMTAKKVQVFIPIAHFFQQLVENECGVTSFNEHQATQLLVT